jgi:hypothetical protein
MQTAVINGEDWLSPRFREMLVGDHLGYNVENCRMVRTNAMTCVRYRLQKFIFRSNPIFFHLLLLVDHVSTEKMAAAARMFGIF